MIFLMQYLPWLLLLGLFYFFFFRQMRGGGPGNIFNFGKSRATLVRPENINKTFKDVAGMCRSFDYLLRHVAKMAGATYRPEDLEQLEACYLAAYRTIAGGQPWWPAAPREAAALLAIYKLDKAIYELAYELQNRPDWVDVPLAALSARNPAAA
ncbi:MAG: hypothetical protein WCJ18_07310 [Planctomycetota bacterium]